MSTEYVIPFRGNKLVISHEKIQSRFGEITLTADEATLLILLAMKPRKTVSHAALRKAVFKNKPQTDVYKKNYIAIVIREIRTKLHAITQNSVNVPNKWGKGYRLTTI